MTDSTSVAIVHYHLHPGGVTRVIAHAAQILQERGIDVVVLAGSAPENPDAFPAAVRVLPELNYDDRPPQKDADRALADAMADAAADALGGAPSLWHVHNHSLGKNAAYIQALGQLADRGGRLLLQMHDFAEDGRPGNYRRLLENLDAPVGQLGPLLYPQHGRVHYATLNHRDHAHLIAAGFDAKRTHWLPNAVDLSFDPDEPVAPQDGRLFLYPTRAIRRKNIGEMCFWAAVAGPEDRFAATLAPNNPAERPRYDAWVSFAADLDLPAEFEAGTKTEASFTSLLRSAHALITTSVAEGFGLAFLEPWLVGRPLLGRNLPAITQDFANDGVDLGDLYERLLVPLEWVGADTFRASVRQALEEAYADYGQAVPADAQDRALAAATDGDRVDFGRLDEAMQKRAIEAVRVNGAAQPQPTMIDQVRPSDLTLAEANGARVRQAYTLEGYGQRVETIYGTVLEAADAPAPPVSAQAVLDRFLRPEDLFLLRTS